MLVLAGAVVLFGAIVGDGPGRSGAALLAVGDAPERGAQAGPAEEGAGELGRELFARNCSSCHGGSGEGRVGPAFAGNDGLAETEAVVAQILGGGVGMPAFGRLTDEEVAAVATHIRTGWGNDFGAVSPQEVAAGR